METHHDDPRIARTKQMLRNALMQLIEEKGFEGVTVRDLTTKAGLNRGTFYLHYKDKYDLLDQSKEEVWREYEKLLQGIDSVVLIESSSRGKAYPLMEKVFEFIQANADFFTVMLGPKGDPSFILRMKNLLGDRIYANWMRLQPPNFQSPVPIDFLLAFITSAQVGVMQHWLKTGMAIPPKEMALMLTRIIWTGPLQSSGIVDILQDSSGA